MDINLKKTNLFLSKPSIINTSESNFHIWEFSLCRILQDVRSKSSFYLISRAKSSSFQMFFQFWEIKKKSDGAWSQPVAKLW